MSAMNAEEHFRWWSLILILIKLEKTGGKCNERARNSVRCEQELAHNVTHSGSVAFEI